jgi:Zn-finger nucleic acid-binding protein
MYLFDHSDDDDDDASQNKYKHNKKKTAPVFDLSHLVH